jgi:O-antigen ligase
MRQTRLAEAIEWWLPVCIAAALPTLGLLAGPAYSSLIVGLAVVQLGHRLASGRGWPGLDWPLATLAGAFLALCWASASWSIEPRTSLHAALAETGILAAMLLACVPRHDPEELADTLFPVLLGACMIGAALACADLALGSPLETLVSGKPGIASITKYNRGMDYLTLIVWPALCHAWWRRQFLGFLVAIAAVGIVLAAGVSLAGQAAAAVGLLVLILAGALPRLVPIVLAAGTGIFVAAQPFALRLLATERGPLAPHLKGSGLQRLQIWDYMTARVMERPLLGWGLQSAKSVPIRASELASYIDFENKGIYPHNQWLQLWVELGALGAAAGLGFAWLVLVRIRRMPMPARPFACAAFAAAMTIASVNYEFTTDSWWAALAASGILFMILVRQMKDEGAP